MSMTVQQIARLCHQANKALCESFGDTSQVDFDLAQDWQRQSAIAGVEFRLNNPGASNSSQHDAWLKDKLAQGWRYGSVKDSVAKTHPCIVPYEELPPHEKAKDAIFGAIVDNCRSLM